MRIAVVGLGKLGSTVAAVAANAGHWVYGADPIPVIVDAINAGRSPTDETGLDALIRSLPPGRLRATRDPYGAVEASEMTLVIVPTPSRPDGAFSSQAILEAIDMFGSAVRGDWHTIVICSTVMPGETMGPIRQRLEATIGRKHGDGWGLVYSPLFIAIGSIIHDMRTPDLVLVGTDSDRAAERFDEYLRSYLQCAPYPAVVRMRPIEAELAKIAVNCYSDDTEVLTSAGWRLFRDVPDGARILTLDHETMQVSWHGIASRIAVPYSGEMLHFYSKQVDTLVTPNHRMLVGTITSGQLNIPGRSYYRKWRLVEAEALAALPAFAFQKETKWEGISPPHVTITSRTIPTQCFAEFMGWYLAEGCVSQLSTNGWMIVISQDATVNPERYQKVQGVMKQMAGALNIAGSVYQVGKEHRRAGWAFNDRDFAIWLAQFGHARDKWVPDVIKDLSQGYIRVFLDAYNEGDGSRYERRSMKGNLKKEQTRVYSSSSEKMAADLGELIIKIGRFPSYLTTRSKLSGLPHYRVAELTSKVSARQRGLRKVFGRVYEDPGTKIRRVPYDGTVYCLRLAHNDVLLTRRNGRCAWHGNSYITTKLAFVNNLAEIARASGADPFVVSRAVGQDRRIGSRYFLPGGKTGGPCFPRDGRAYALNAERAGCVAPLARAVEELNQREVSRTVDALKGPGRVAILGLTYKTETSLVEESFGTAVTEALVRTGTEVVLHDPKARYQNALERKATAAEAVAVSDRVLIATPWPEYADPALDLSGKRVIDPWGMRK